MLSYLTNCKNQRVSGSIVLSLLFNKRLPNMFIPVASLPLSLYSNINFFTVNKPYIYKNIT